MEISENPSILQSPSQPPSSNYHNHTPGIRFRYTIFGVPHDRLYSVEEARWSWKKRGFVSETHHFLSASSVKQWFGYVPSTLGEFKSVVWVFLPYTIYKDKTKSPLKMWEENHDVFVPFSFDKLRYEVPSSLTIFQQAMEFPSAFRVDEPCEACIHE